MLTYNCNLPNHIIFSIFLRHRQTKSCGVIAGFRREVDKNCVINQKNAVLKIVITVKIKFPLHLAT